MKTIKIFLASSEELDYDRMAFGNLVRRLDDMYEKRGIRIKLFEWEDYDSAYNDRRKQDEYNDYVRQSDIFLALFHKKAGQFTVEEFDLASQEFKEHASPKVYTYCKDLKPGEEETPELTEFKKRLFDEMGHYWCSHLDFVMQLLMQDKIQKDELNIEEGQVMLNGMVIAQMDNLQGFPTDNKGNQDLIKDLEKIEIELNEIRQALDQNPNIDFIKKQYELKKNEYNQKKEEARETSEEFFQHRY